VKKEFAVEGMTLLVVGEIPSEGVTGVVAIVGLPDSKKRQKGNKVYLHDLSLLVSGVTAAGTAPPATTPDPLSINGNIQASGSKTRDTITSKQLLRLDDETNIMTASPLTSGGTPVPVNFRVKIVDAGQTGWRGE